MSSYFTSGSSDSAGSDRTEYGDLKSTSIELGPTDNLALAVPIGRNWNEEFQTLLDISFENEDEEMQRMSQLRQLSMEFAARASEIGQTIIREKDLPLDQKTIKPHTKRVGGYAGGEKYLHDGIFFKFAVDNHGLYGDDEHAMKCGAQEFKNFMELADCRVQGLHFPLIVILDYRGFRLLCQSVLPIGINTLIYGSSDGGKTIHADDEEMNKRMKRVAKTLNLVGHNVYNSARTRYVRIHGPVDCEGHLGVDGRFYIIDPARLFPPCVPNPAIKGSKLFMLLRPELVLKSRHPLCSDSFSNFHVENRSAFDAHVEQIDRHLHTELIPEFSQKLCHEYHNKYNTLFEMASASSNNTNIVSSAATEANTLSNFAKFSTTMFTAQSIDTSDLDRLVNEAHRKGINLRYFGEVRQRVPSLVGTTSPPAMDNEKGSPTNPASTSDYQKEEKKANTHIRTSSQDEDERTSSATGSLGLELLRSVLLTLIVGRVVKNLIRSHLRTIRTVDERPYHKLMLTYLNLLFGRTTKTAEFWTKAIKKSIATKFPHSLSSYELQSDYNLRLSILPYTLYLYLQELLGLEMRLEAKAKFSNLETETEQIMKNVGLPYWPPQYSLFKPLVDTDLMNVLPKVRYTNRMSFEEATALSRKARYAGSPESSDKYFQLAENNYKAALKIKPDDYRALHNWGLSLAMQALTKSGNEAAALYDLARSKWKQALELNPQDFRAHMLWGNMLLERAESIPTAQPHHMSTSSSAQARQVFESSNKLLLSREREKLTFLVEACDHYKLSYDLNEDQYETLYNWATALLLRGTLDSQNALTLYEEAANLYQGATALKENSLKAHLNWAVALAKCARCTFDVLTTGVFSNRRSREMAALELSQLSISPASASSTSTFAISSFSNSFDSLQALPKGVAKAFKKSEKLFQLSFAKFDECVDLRPDDCEVYFNYGNAIYRRARVHEKFRSHLTALELCSQCCERYISAINIKLNYYDALYNWGSVISFLTTLPSLEAKDMEIMFMVNCYLEVFKKVALRYGSMERFKLDPIISLIHSKRDIIQRRAIQTINILSTEGKDAVQREAARVMKSILASPMTRRILNDETIEENWSKFSIGIVRSIGVVDKSVQEEDETGRVTIDSFALPTILDGGDAGLGTMMRTVRKSTQQPHIMIIVPHKELLDRLGILENEESFAGLNREQAQDLRRSFLSQLKAERPYLAQLQYSFQTEEDDYCLIYKYNYNPGILWDFLSNASTPVLVREQHIRFYAAEVLLALQSLHSKEMMYGDLNPVEMLLDHQGHLVLHKVPYSQQATIKPSSLSPEYVAPEVLTSQQSYKAITDWYCFGVFLYQLATCKVHSFNSAPDSTSSTGLPKPTKLDKHTRVHSADKDQRFEVRWNSDGTSINFGSLANSVSRELKDLISSLLLIYPKTRLKSAQKIQKHPFWGNLQWKLMETASLQPPFTPGQSSSGLLNSFTAVPTLLAKLKRGKFHGYSFVEP